MTAARKPGPALDRAFAPCPPGVAPDEWTRCANMAEHHGMRAVTCPRCEGGGCAACDHEGVLWGFTDPRACGQNCPLTQRGN